ncbi:carboxyl-terminal processing protease CtpB [Leptolyngbya sp. AN02str]|uniref:carboxyl-terminal processing protease CtpB n=1 Tax=Leptolyngbya sp. AN02str TaxID=3423363 RepID=UPI003D3229D8
MPQSPRRARLLDALLFCGTVATSVCVSLLTPALSSAVQTSLQDSPKAVLDEAWQIVYREYVDESFNSQNWVAIRQELLNREYSSRDEAYAYLRRALQRLNDPYTRFMNPRQFEALTNQTSGELSGVGIRLQADEQVGGIKVVEPIPNSPASAAGIQPGDRILSIDGVSTQGMSLEDASNRIRGELGTNLVLDMSRDGQDDSFSVTLTRARIELPNVNHTVKQEQGVKIGYIRLTEFSAHSAEQMQRAIEDLLTKDVEGFVLDLRGNPGGLLDASIAIARMWLPNGTIVRTVDRNGFSDTTRANNTALTQLPLVVLVDSLSASSSEILTGALMDNNRATVVGTTTFGKALVQSVHRLSDGSGLAVTVSHYYTPNGTDISQLGITPHIQVDLNEAQQQQLASHPDRFATQADPQYARAVGALQSTISTSRQRQQAAQPSRTVRETNLSIRSSDR